MYLYMVNGKHKLFVCIGMDNMYNKPGKLLLLFVFAFFSVNMNRTWVIPRGAKFFSDMDFTLEFSTRAQHVVFIRNYRNSGH